MLNAELNTNGDSVITYQRGLAFHFLFNVWTVWAQGLQTSRKIQIINFYEVYWINFLNLLSSDGFNSLNYEKCTILEQISRNGSGLESFQWKLEVTILDVNRATFESVRNVGVVHVLVSKHLCQGLLWKSSSALEFECTRNISQTTCIHYRWREWALWEWLCSGVTEAL